MKRKLSKREPRRRRERRRRRRPGRGEVRAWVEAAQAAIEEGDLPRAFELARRLRARGGNLGYEIEALAHLQAGARDEAMRVVERGLRVVGDVWSLWQLLGNARSDAGRYAEAHAAYDRALACLAPDREQIDLNRAVLLQREGRVEEALALARTREPATLGGRYAGEQARCLTLLGRPAEARELLRAVLEADEGDEAEELDHRGTLLAHYAELSLSLGDREEAGRAALEAHWYERGHPHALACLRELEGARDPSARRFRLTLRGELPEPLRPGDPPTGFCTMTSVVARDLDDALARSLTFEPAELHGSIVVEEHELLEAAPEQALGVYFVSRYLLYRLDGRASSS